MRAHPLAKPRRGADVGAAAVARAVGADLGSRLPGGGWAAISPHQISSRKATSSGSSSPATEQTPTLAPGPIFGARFFNLGLPTHSAACLLVARAHAVVAGSKWRDAVQKI